MGWIQLITALPTVIKAVGGIVDTVGNMLPTGSSHEKREKAREEIKVEMEKENIEVKEHFVNFLLELGVLVKKYDLDVEVEDNSVVKLKPKES